VSKLFNLIANENMKIYRRIRTWILIGLVIIIALASALLLKSFGGKVEPADWKSNVSAQIQADKQQLQVMKNEHAVGIDLEIRRLEADIKANEYRLDHDLPPAQNNMWSGMSLSVNLISLVTIFTVIVAADIVAGEFSGGTIKLLLIRPASRSKILLSKFIATIEFSIVLLILLFMTSFIINGILYGFADFSQAYVYASNDGTVHVTNMFMHTVNTYLLNCIHLVMIVSLAFMISTVFRSSSLAIGISMAVMFLGGAIMAFFSNKDWIKYYLFANTDLSVYMTGQPIRPDMTLGFSIAVLAVYFIIFNALSWTIFNKRDVAA
jgi:ABC-2 type transport system permease protein